MSDQSAQPSATKLDPESHQRWKELQLRRMELHVQASEVRLEHAKVKLDLAKLHDDELTAFVSGPRCW
ncbi:hypothetical protein ACI6QG_14680 [Roseococcus sp. DSY-14]|uniref:hypothetical protein n=1 Tax=Roseococcus sp. DSY-14 TaxID=3369650 RepID=UPI00387AC0DC